MALEEKGIDIKKLTQIRFRNKTNFGLSSQDAGQVYKTLTPAGIQDMYTYAFLTSLDLVCTRHLTSRELVMPRQKSNSHREV